MTLTLTDFLLARIAEVVATVERQGRDADECQECAIMQQTPGEESPLSSTRVLASCEAKRRIVETTRFSGDNSSAVDYWLEPERRDLYPGTATAVLTSVIKFLALPYADHPDYRDEWRP